MTRNIPISIRARLAGSAIALVLIVVAAIAVASYREVRRSAIAAAGQRAERVAAQLGQTYANSARALLDEVQVAAQDAAMQRALRLRDTTAARVAAVRLAARLSGRNTLASVELWDDSGSRLTTTNDSVMALGADDARALIALVSNGPGASIGWLAGVPGDLGYSIVSPVVAGATRHGFLVERRRVAASAQSTGPLRDLIGPGSTLLVGNSRGDLWTSLGEVAPPIPSPTLTGAGNEAVQYERPDGRRVIASLVAIPNSPWTLAVEFPLDVVLTPARAMIWRLTLLTLTLIALAALGAWFVSGTLTRPIATLVRAAKGMTAGDESQRVAIVRSDELGTLGGAFNEMAERVARTRGALESKIDELVNAEARYQILFDASPQPTWVFDLETRGFLAVNHAATQRYGYTVDEFLKMSILDIRALADRSAVLANLVVEADSDRASSSVTRHRLKDGSSIDVEAHARSLTLGGRRARLVVVSDLTERRRAEESLRLTQERLERVIRSSGAVLYEMHVTPDGPVLDWISDNVRSMLGFDLDEAYAPHWWRANVHPDDDAAASGYAAPASSRVTSRDYRFRNKDGRYRWLRAEQRASADESGQEVHVVGAWLDITNQKQLEERLSQTQKMEAMGLLAGGVAHDFNNMLTVVRGYSALVAGEVGDDRKITPMINEIIRATDRAAELTKQLLSFSRGRVMERQVLNVSDVVRETQPMLTRLIDDRIELIVRLDADVLPVLADRGQLTQVLTNLTVNARDAMPSGGSLVIETSRVTLTASQAEQHAVRPGNYILVAVTDTGMGMDEATQARIFEPFFTTKSEGRGTGLGLSTVFGIIKQLEGTIWVYSEPNHGTTFRIYLPHFDGRPRRGATPHSVASAARIAGARVLLVDDDTTVLRLTRQLLERAGYVVVEAENGASALDALQMAEVDVVVSDTVMPVMGGHELVARLAEERPALPVVLTSGYSANAMQRVNGTVRLRFFIEKPFTGEALDTIVQEALRSALEG